MAVQELPITQQTHSITKEDILNDYRIACESRQTSLVGRKEVFMGKAKFGIFGDGKEVAQVAMARYFQNGDFRSGYYRDQTFMFAIGESTIEQFFAQLYAHTDLEADPFSGGRSMNAHFATRSLDENGKWKSLTDQKNTSADVSPTAGQMPRLLGLAFASKLFRQNTELHHLKQFSKNGNEIAFGTIGNASTAEGMFFETINAASVLQVPMVISIWDDNYGISVPNEYQMAKGDISEILKGFQRDDQGKGMEIIKVKGWNYPALLDAYEKATEIAREEHVPVMVHVVEMTQPQGHSTSGSHERYKSKERLDWEKEYDCNLKMREWILKNEIATPEELDELEKAAAIKAKAARKSAWNAYLNSLKKEKTETLQLLSDAAKASKSAHIHVVAEIKKELEKSLNPIRLDNVRAVKKALRVLRNEPKTVKEKLLDWLEKSKETNYDRFSSFLYNEYESSALKVPEIKPVYNEADSPTVDGREVMQACFDAMLQRDPRVLAFGEDLGKIGDVNQGFAGLQEKYGELRVMDTGIRETTIIGQGIGAALRGLRPIAEIQYLDYIFYAIATLTDDLACLQYRTKGGQTAPLIIRTRGHRLEGIWHSGSPIGTLLHCLRGLYLLVPRNMTQAAGFYNTLLQAEDPALIIECLNGYRLKERLPANISEFTVPLGVPEVIKEGSDVTIVTYGSMCRIVMDAAAQLAELGINCEVVDVQSLLPFDIHHNILESVKKTNRVIFADEDVSGGGTGYMMQKVLHEQKAYQWLDSQPVCISAKDHRPAYSSDGDYFSKPSVEDIFDAVYALMHELDPSKFPAIY
ncbi:thiamine pyrophosphate-dependent enzyme [Flammeovirgaceae bacterium SG7u.111]|nr:thiamine pyrophosphate-dependent enzyme [Flammeovirgaceae bacterium SG7u.132]WPO37003.1 thiamine pyrophosphate-dependent enzyme [Flammeovirgaceae bacterium SG7u.111]